MFAFFFLTFDFSCILFSRLSGPDHCDEWRRESRRIIPLLPRSLPITGFSQIAKAAKEDIASLNRELPAPWDTHTVRTPSPLKREVKTPEPEFVKPEPVADASPPQQNGRSPEKVKTEVKQEAEEGDETGMVFLPSGMAVRLSEEKPPPGKKGGKRKRSVSKSIEVFPKGVPISTKNAGGCAGRRESLGSPPRKVSSPLSPVHKAGHGYARPPPPNTPSGGQQLVGNSTAKPDEAMLLKSLKRGPGRPPGPSSPGGGTGRGSARTRAPRAPRARGPRGSRGRGGRAAAGAGQATSNSLPPLPQSPLVQGQGLFNPVHPGARTVRTSTPKLAAAGFSNKDIYAALNATAHPVSSATANSTQTYPRDLSTSSGGGEVKQSLHSLAQAIGYLQAQAAAGNNTNQAPSQAPNLGQSTGPAVPMQNSVDSNATVPSSAAATGGGQQQQSFARIITQATSQAGVTLGSPQKTVLVQDSLTSEPGSQAAASSVQLVSQGTQQQQQQQQQPSSVAAVSGSCAQPPPLQFASGQSLTQLNSQGLKVISHNTKIVPKSAGTVYVMPSSGGGQRLMTPGSRIVTVSVAAGGGGNAATAAAGGATTPRLGTPGVSSVIRTIRTSAFPGTNKSVIVVQKSAPGIRAAGRTGSVALYRPANAPAAATRGLTPIIRGGGAQAGVMRIPASGLQRPTLVRQQGSNGNLYLVDLGQDQQQQQVSFVNNTGANNAHIVNSNSSSASVNSPAVKTLFAKVPSSSGLQTTNNSIPLLPNNPATLVSVLPQKSATVMYSTGGGGANHQHNRTVQLTNNSATTTSVSSANKYPNMVTLLPNHPPPTTTAAVGYTALLANTKQHPSPIATTTTAVLPNNTPTTTAHATLFQNNVVGVSVAAAAVKTPAAASVATLPRVLARPVVGNSTKTAVPIVLNSSGQPAFSKKLVTQLGASDPGGNGNPDLWIQLKETPNAAPAPAVGGHIETVKPIRVAATTPVKQVTPSTLSVNDAEEPSYSDIFSQALEQANIPADTPLVDLDADLGGDKAMEPSGGSGGGGSLLPPLDDPPLLSKTLSTTSGRFVTLPPRPNNSIAPSSSSAAVQVPTAAMDLSTMPPPAVDTAAETQNSIGGGISPVNEITNQTSDSST